MYSAGVGLEPVARSAAQTFAPDVSIIYEGGSIGSVAVGRILGIDDTVIQVNAECQTDAQHAGLAGPDRTRAPDLPRCCPVRSAWYLNTTLYGDDYTRPAARQMGSGGGHDPAGGS